MAERPGRFRRRLVPVVAMAVALGLGLSGCFGGVVDPRRSSTPSTRRSTTTSRRASTRCSTRPSRSAVRAEPSPVSGRPGPVSGPERPARSDFGESARGRVARTPASTWRRSRPRSPARCCCDSSTRAPSSSTTRSTTTSTGSRRSTASPSSSSAGTPPASPTTTRPCAATSSPTPRASGRQRAALERPRPQPRGPAGRSRCGESRTGILLLALALERRTGKSWTDLAEQYVFGPLGLEDTRMPQPVRTPITQAVLGAYSAGIAPNGAVDCAVLVDDSDQSSSMGGAAAGAVSTLEDTRALSEAFATGALLSEATERKQWAAIPLGGSAPAWQTVGIGALQYGPMRGSAGEIRRRAHRGLHRPRERAHRGRRPQQLDRRRRTSCARRRSRSPPSPRRRTRPTVASARSSSCRGRSNQATAKMQELGICPKA